MEPVVVFFFLSVTVGSVILLPLFWRTKERRQALEIVRIAVERDGPVPVELMSAMGSAFRARREISPAHDMRRGLVLLALGGAIMMIGLICHLALRMIPDDDSYVASLITGLIVGSIGVIPAFVGAAYILLGTNAKRPQA